MEDADRAAHVKPRLQAIYRGTLGRFGRDEQLVLIAMGLSAFAANGIFTVLFNIYLLRLGYDTRFIGLMAAGVAAGRATACLLAAAVGSRWGTRLPMLVGIALTITSYALLPLNEVVPQEGRAGWLLTTSIMGSVGLAVKMVNFTAFTMGATTPDQRTHAFSLNAAMAPLAGFAGSLLGGFLPGALSGALDATLQDVAPYRYALSVTPLLLLPVAWLIWQVREVDVARTGEMHTARGRAPYGLMALLTLVMILRWAGRGPTTTFFNVYLDDALGASTALIGALTAAGNLVAVPAALLMPAIVARWGAYRALVWGSVGMALSILPLALIPHPAAAGAWLIVTLALFGITSPAITVFSQEMVELAWRAAMSGVMNMSVGLGSALIALGGGYAISAFGYRAVFLFSATAMIVGALVFGVAFRVPRGALARQAGR